VTIELSEEPLMNKSGDINQILLVTRWLVGVVLPFLVTAFVILFIFPNQTEKLFAWKIQPAMSAMMLGAAYAGGIWFFAGNRFCDFVRGNYDLTLG